jgi:hypothetical protein
LLITRPARWPIVPASAGLGVLRDLDLERLIGREQCRERDLVVAMIVQRLIAPGSKLSATRRFAQTTLSDELSLSEVTESELLCAMDWLLERQDRIERRLANQQKKGPTPTNTGDRALNPQKPPLRPRVEPMGRSRRTADTSR